MSEEGGVCCSCGEPFPPIPTTPPDPFHIDKIAVQEIVDEGVDGIAVRWYEYCVPCHNDKFNNRKKR